MKTYLKRIKGILPTTEQAIDLDIDGKALVVTGKTGAGKTAFLRFVHEKVEGASSAKELKTLPRLLAMLENLRSVERNQDHDPSQQQQWQEKLAKIEAELDEVTRELSLDIAKKAPSFNIKSGRFLRFYESDRSTYILPANGSLPGEQSLLVYKGDHGDHARYLEQYLLRRKLEFKDDHDQPAAITQWFDNIERCLRILLGCDSTSLHFDRNKLAITLSQKQRGLFRFQDLSPGHLSVLCIWADLLVRAEAYQTSTAEFKGIVIIDEIDVHLDISLQRTVLPFLIAQFPNIQFIVSTNSPLVVMSVDQPVVFDAGTVTSLRQDFSFYSFEAMASDVFHTSIAPSARQTRH